ncbi:MAG: nuclear transport factor 2 family protein [Spirochaetia bacterium]
MSEYRITSLEQFLSLWKDIYTAEGTPSWDRMLPYYAQDIHFKDSVQEIRGKKKFTAMTQRLAKRSKSLEFLIHNAVMEGDLVFVEWEMVISYKRYPKSSVYGASRILLRDGKVAEQRDYYDLWGDIFDNIIFLSSGYRRFMRRLFG